MKTLITILSFIVVTTLATGLSSCGKDDPVTCGATWGQDLEPELNALSTALTNYINDQNLTTCTALQNAYQAYLSALRPYADCAALSSAERSQLNAAISDAEAELEGLCDDI
jgi:hypothetical protein